MAKLWEVEDGSRIVSASGREAVVDVERLVKGRKIVTQRVGDAPYPGRADVREDDGTLKAYWAMDWDSVNNQRDEAEFVWEIARVERA